MRKQAIILAILLGLVSALSYAQAPVPFINLPLIPDATAPGGPQFTLTVNGTGFVSNSVVNWNGSALATQFVSGSKLTAIVPASDITTASTGWVTVVNPAPGGGTSNLAFFSVTASTSSVAFDLASSPAVGRGPVSVAAGDFNGDNKLDLAVANSGSNTVSILLGDNSGNFTLTSSPPVDSPCSVALGDFNGDGKLDLAITSMTPSLGDNVFTLLGDGTGNFTLASTTGLGQYYYPYSVAAGDFNGDGKLDLAIAGEYGVRILLGDGLGSFTLGSFTFFGYTNLSVAVGDFNGDGELDLAVANNNYNDGNKKVYILLGDGMGNFNLFWSIGLGISNNSLAAGDFDGDGKLDLAVANASDNTVSILLGDGTGRFTLTSSPAAGNSPSSVAVADFNGDGKLDLAVANASDNTVSILLGDGTGRFTLASSPGAGANPNSVAVGDFNGDGKPDLAVANFTGSGTVSILLATVPAVTLSPTSLTFGTQLIGTSSNPQPVTLTNTGSETLDITKIAASWNFSQTNNCPSSVPPSGQCTINVSFVPHYRNKITGAVTITDNAANSPQTVPLTGVGTLVTLLPLSLNFGDQQVGTTSPPQVATLTNHGKGAVNIHGIHITGANPRQFAQTNNCGTSVPAGGSCTISVTFSPRSKGSKTATLEVKDNGGASPQTVALSGTGTK